MLQQPAEAAPSPEDTPVDKCTPATADPPVGTTHESLRGRLRRLLSRRRTVVVLASVVVLLLGSAVFGGVRALPAYQHLRSAGVLLQQLRDQIQRGESKVARGTLTSLQGETVAARRAIAGPDWRLGAHAPVIGDDVTAVRTVASVLDDLSHDALPAMLDLADSFQMSLFAPKGGRLDLAPLAAFAPGVARLDASVRHAHDRMSAIRLGGLVSPLRAAVKNFIDGLNRLGTLTAVVARATALLPAMLGAHGPRTYLVLFQNPAEIRATGGMPGAFSVVRADRGALRIVDQGSASGLQIFEQPVLPLDRRMRDLYTDKLGIFPADINLTPHFPTAAALAREMYRRRTGLAVDGVIATDPVALSYVLRATGPIRVGEGVVLQADTAVRQLLSDVYAKMDKVGQDRLFAAAARGVFEALTGGVRDPASALAALGQSAGERRLLVWSSHGEEEKALAGTVLEGALPEQDGAAPIVGLFLNDGSGAKLDYYLTHSARLRVTGCQADGRRVLSLHATLGSTAPTSGLSESVTGLALAGDPYTARTLVSVFSPARGSIAEVRVDGRRVPVGSGVERHRAVGLVMVDVKPGQTRTIDVELLTAPLPLDGRTRVTPSLRVTPGVNPWGLYVDSRLICPAAR